MASTAPLRPTAPKPGDPRPDLARKRPLLGYRRSRADRWYTHLALLVVTIVVAFPLLYAMIVSTQANAEFFACQLTPGRRLMENFEFVWEGRQLGGYLFNSAIQSVIITVGKTLTALLAGLAFVHLDFPGKWWIFWFVLVTLMMPTEISIIALFQIVSGFGR